MLDLAFLFKDASHELSRYSDHLAIAPLPATVYLMQLDVINHYRHALRHYFTLSLNEPFLQNSSLGTPYQKWAYFTNENFSLLATTIQQLLRYTSRLIHEMAAPRRIKSPVGISNSYTSLIVEIRHWNKAIGIRVHDDHRLSLFQVRTEPPTVRVVSRSEYGGPTRHFRIDKDNDGKDVEESIELDEVRRLTGEIQEKVFDIRDRAVLAHLQQLGETEVAELEKLNLAFGELCRRFYGARPLIEPFGNLNESYWI